MGMLGTILVHSGSLAYGILRWNLSRIRGDLCRAAAALKRPALRAVDLEFRMWYRVALECCTAVTSRLAVAALVGKNSVAHLNAFVPGKMKAFT